MKRLLLLLPLVLVGCASTGFEGAAQPQQPADPQLRAAVANAEMTATQSAADELSAQATEQEARAERQSEREIAREMAPVTAQAAMLELQITAGAATDQAAQKTATATAQVATSVVAAAQATQTREAEVNRASADNIKSIAWGIFWAVVIVGTIIAAIIISYRLIKRWQDQEIDFERYRLKLERQKNSIVMLPNGTVVYMGANGPEIITQSKAPSLPGGTWGDGDKLVMSGGNLRFAARKPDNSTTGRALELLEFAIKKGKAYTDQIPGHREIGWSSSKWTRVINALKDLGIADANNKETHLLEQGPYKNVYELYTDLRNNKLILPPSPTPTYPQAGD